MLIEPELVTVLLEVITVVITVVDCGALEVVLRSELDSDFDVPALLVSVITDVDMLVVG